MTWRELAEEISKMTNAERDQDVRFMGPYDEAAGYVVDLCCAAEDLFTDQDEEEPFVNNGEWFLRP